MSVDEHIEMFRKIASRTKVVPHKYLSAYLRQNAKSVITLRRSREGREAFRGLLEDPVPEVALWVARDLLSTGDEQALPVLERIAKQTDSTGDYARRALSRYEAGDLTSAFGQTDPQVMRARLAGREMLTDDTDTVESVLDRHIRDAIHLTNGSLAWCSDGASRILKDLGSTKIAIVGGELYLAEPMGPLPAFDGWTCPRAPGETAVDYAMRTRELAEHKVTGNPTMSVVVILEFSDQQDAA